MIIICPYCKKEVEYTPRTPTGRKRKLCSCGKKFNIPLNSKNNSKIIIKQRTKATYENNFDLNSIDGQIIELIREQGNFSYSLTQSIMSKKLKKSQSTISKHLKKLIKNGFIWEIGRRLKTYRLNYPKEDIGKIIKFNAVTAHKIQVICKILQGKIDPKKFKIKHMKNNDVKIFTENDLKFQLTTKSLIFWPTSIGKTSELAINNAKEKANTIKKYFEMTYNCKLSFPDFTNDRGKQKIHYVPVKTTKKEFLNLQEAWCDKSHDGSIESSGKEFVSEIIKINEEFQEIKTKIQDKDLEKNITKIIKNEMEIFKVQITEGIAQAVGISVTSAFKDVLIRDNNSKSQLNYI